MSDVQVRSLIAGNWKMNGTRESLSEVKKMCSDLARMSARSCDVLICPPATLISQVADLGNHAGLMTGAQDCHTRTSGAHTGDISASMLRDAGASHVILGHSERRSDHGETDGLVKAKAEAALAAGLVPIICVGETQAERNSGLALTVVEHQLSGSVPPLSEGQTIAIAYEPVWAIGTGLVPTEAEIAEIHANIRTWLIERFGDSGKGMAILYGGSMKPENAESILAIDHVNGGLIGGASLKAADFIAIVAASKNVAAKV